MSPLCENQLRGWKYPQCNRLHVSPLKHKHSQAPCRVRTCAILACSFLIADVLAAGPFFMTETPEQILRAKSGRNWDTYDKEPERRHHFQVISGVKYLEWFIHVQPSLNIALQIMAFFHPRELKLMTFNVSKMWRFLFSFQSRNSNKFTVCFYKFPTGN